MEKIIDAEISKLVEHFYKYPHCFLTEEDARCYLVKKLMKHRIFSQVQKTNDNKYSWPVHTEVRWYGNSGRLNYRSDIVIIDVSNLKVDKNINKLYSKGFVFNNSKAIIEIKLRRDTNYSDNKFITEIKKEIEKIDAMKNEIIFPGIYRVVCLDKKRNIRDKIRNSFINYNENIVYSSTGVL